MIRPCRSIGEFSACVALQKQIWGYAPREVYPLRLFVTLCKVGGHVLGAFTSAEELVGFVASMPAWHGRSRYYYSLCLGVASAHENRGLGKALKLKQRKMALRAGIDCIEWTYDPMRAKNAFFNIERLGVLVRRYLPSHYGRVRSRLQQGLPSDRLVAEWWLKSPRVMRAIAGESPRQPKCKPVAELSIPLNFGSPVKSQADKALALQSAVRKQLQQYLLREWVITGFSLDKEFGQYLFDPLSETGLTR